MRTHLTSTVQKYKYDDFYVDWQSAVDSDSEAGSDKEVEGEEEEVCVIHRVD
jgi:hypothetical protein